MKMKYIRKTSDLVKMCWSPCMYGKFRLGTKSDDYYVYRYKGNFTFGKKGDNHYVGKS